MNEATVDFVKDAKVGDTVWCFDTNKSRYNIDGKYVGRGGWDLQKIVSETRQSFSLSSGAKFKRKTGEQMATGGWAAWYSICGQKEYEASRWMKDNSLALARAVEKCRNIDSLMQIAALAGYAPITTEENSR